MTSPPPMSYGPELPFSTAELDACIKVASSLADYPDLFLAPWLRSLRKAIVPLVEKLKSTKGESIGQKRVRERAFIRQALHDKARWRDHKAIQQCTLRAGRIAKLQRLRIDHDISTAVPLIPDGPVRDDDNDDQHHTVPKLMMQTASSASPHELFYPRECYVCLLHFTELHVFYDRLCPSCAAHNYTKRHQTADLHGKIALVTGARVKIGFFTSLKLLQAGATVIATTRFPCDAMARYQEEPQFEQFKGRLHIFGIDLRDLVHVHCFLDYVASTFSRLDIVIHNAAQTVRRPPQYYKHLVAKELALDQQATSQCVYQSLLTHHTALQSRLKAETDAPRSLSLQSDPLALCSTESHHTIVHSPIPSALKSQIAVLASDLDVNIQSFPPGLLDVNGQQVDLRSTNSWTARLGEIETPEVAEVFTINAMAPFVINNRLLPMLVRPINATDPKFIVNVSAMEGKFNRAKGSKHPHTNMAKAALNMMTRTCAADLSRRLIYMNSVDTGWINDENPLPVAYKETTEKNFQTPLDEIDAAARVLDPIFSAVLHPQTTPEWGSFLKDYSPTEW